MFHVKPSRDVFHVEPSSDVFHVEPSSHGMLCRTEVVDVSPSRDCTSDVSPSRDSVRPMSVRLVTVHVRCQSVS